MALSDCEKCWDTPCTCGHYWRNYSEEAKRKQCEAIMGEKMYSREDLPIQAMKDVLEYCEDESIENTAFVVGFYSDIKKWIEENLLS